MLYRITGYNSDDRLYAWGEAASAQAFEKMLNVHNYEDITIEVYYKKQWRVIKGRSKIGKYK